MNTIAQEIFATGKVFDSSGKEYTIHSHTRQDQCEFLVGIITEIKASRCLEVGLAYGLSALHICEAIEECENAVYYSIDINEGGWGGVGLKNLIDAGYGSFVKFNHGYSHEILPKLCSDNVELDFAYVDTSKVFDVVLTDAYYINQMLKVGGVIVLDDCNTPGINRLIRYLSKMPCYEVYKLHNPTTCSFTRNLASKITRAVPYSEKIFADKIRFTDTDLGVNSNCVALRKISEDERNWDWYKPF
jgi:predicted O-methyltransferase YrrM